MSTDLIDDGLARVVNPLVFISHDSRDADLAEAFGNLLKSVSAGVLKSFRTSDRRGNQGIEYGVEWYPEIIKNIQSASDVVCLITKRSVDRPWILFEAGMAKGKLDTPILGVALGIELKDASIGPFAQFQNCGDDAESLTKLVFQLVKRIPNSEPDEETIKFQVAKFIEAIEIIAKKPANLVQAEQVPHQKSPNDSENSSAKLFEEIKIMFQDLPSRIDRSNINPPRRIRRIRPSMIEEIFQISPDPRIGFRIALSLYKEKLPWIYDEGIILVNKIISSKSPDMKFRYMKEFDELLRFSLQIPYFHEVLIEEKSDQILLSELPNMLMRNIERLVHFSN